MFELQLYRTENYGKGWYMCLKKDGRDFIEMFLNTTYKKDFVIHLLKYRYPNIIINETTMLQSK
jgi:hypothetical protein